MILPRFKYSYTIYDAFRATWGLIGKDISPSPILSRLFPSASGIHLISSARVGIKIAIEALRLKNGARVGVQPYTCSSVLAAITAAGCKPLFIDIDDNLRLSCSDMAQKISRIDALIVTHTFGLQADITKIKKIAGQIPVIEDCAHALFSTYRGQQVGTFFDVSVFSFGNGKFPSLGGGGMLVVNNPLLEPQIMAKATQLPKAPLTSELKHIINSYLLARMHSRLGQKVLQKVASESYLSLRNREPIPYPRHAYQMLKSTKRLLANKLSQYEKLSLKQNENSAYLSDLIKNDYNYLANPDDFTNAFSFVLIENDRDALHRFLKRRNIISGKHFQHAKHWVSAYGYQSGDCPVFDRLCTKILTIPCYYSLSKRDLDHLGASLLAYRHLDI